MIKPWRSDDLPPKFPVKKQEIKIEISIKINTSNWSPILVDWFLNLSEAQRELIVFEGYRKEKLREVGVKINEVYDDS